MRHGERKSKLV